MRNGMRDRILNWTKVREIVGETFDWAGGIYKILNITEDCWIVENMISGRELTIR